MENATRYLLIACAGVIISLGAWWWYQASANNHAHSAQVVFLDVGQGDAIYIRSAQGQDIVIDGGPTDAIIRRLGEAMPFWDRTIELMILTHPDADHITGLVDVFDYYTVQQVAYVPLSVQSQTQQAFLDAIVQQGTAVLHLWSGDMLELSDHEQLRVLYPFPNSPLESLARNDTSQVAIYEFSGSVKLLLTGDISAKAETVMRQGGVLEDIDILKVPHHGSATSSSAEFLQTVQPEVAVIQVGADNQYGHPKPVVLDRLQTYTQSILRTDQLGNIACEISLPGYVCAAQRQ